ncbi:hypothetical protein F5Y15DRAFT_395259 [Xylariaceae sp. FL0016]|nr:hypothetical protein F5Y15DRAFT_395259 [Xylariaceae sp. FL0016]
MASFIGSLLRLTFKRAPREGHTDEEHGSHFAPRPHHDQAAMSSTLGANSSLRGTGHLYPDDDRLTSFRLMMGITTSPHLGFTESSPMGTRPASNIGLYARVVYSEQKSKDSFKVFSLAINACYFLQIVVAAALTAMGAAGANNKAITAFGAINTVIAGFLTFLKGSGLPGRLKYYGNEWKKIREFIEQRERDFMRGPSCPLDVFEVVETIEKMYQNTKQDIEMNTPDSYTSVTNARQMATDRDGKIGGIDMSKLENIAGKLHGLDGKMRSLSESVEEKAHELTKGIHEHEKGIEAEVHSFGGAVAREVERHKTRVNQEVKEREAQVLRSVDDGHKAVREGTQDVKNQATEEGSRAAKELEDIHKGAVEDTRTAAASQIRSFADKL